MCDNRTHSMPNHNYAGNLKAMIEWFLEREGHYPARILANKIYRNRDDLSYCKKHVIWLSGSALGWPKKDEVRNKAQDYQDEHERVEMEHRFSLEKRKYGMGLVIAKLQEIAAHVIALSVLVLNLRKTQRTLLHLLIYLWAIFNPQKNALLFSRYRNSMATVWQQKIR